MFMIRVDYPSAADEIQIMRLATGGGLGKPQRVLNAVDIARLQRVIRGVPVSDHVLSYAQRISSLTRVGTPGASDLAKRYLTWGAGPRASLNLILAAKARAALSGRNNVACDDVSAVAGAVLRHRIILNFSAQSEGVTADVLIRKLVESVPKDQKLEA
jgi:MoxR-like ATPase